MITREYLDMAIRTQDARIEAGFARLESQIDAVRHELLAATRGELVAALAQQTRQMIFATIGTVLSLAALARFI